MIKHADSHVDHGLTEQQLAHILNLFADRSAFFIETVELPDELGTVPCGLYGPVMGDAPIPDEAVHMERRGDREYKSRTLNVKPLAQRTVNVVTVIAGPHDGHPCVLFTAFGGPLSPQEPGDIRRQLEAAEEKRRELMKETHTAGTSFDCEDNDAYREILKLREKRTESDRFWSEHALAGGI